MKTNELTDVALDWAVLTAEGNPANSKWRKADYGGLQVRMTMKLLGIIERNWSAYGPSTIWSQGGPIIERERISIMFTVSKDCGARTLEFPPTYYFGPTPLIAAMRCFVASKLGNEVDVPEELRK